LGTHMCVPTGWCMHHPTTRRMRRVGQHTKQERRSAVSVMQSPDAVVCLVTAPQSNADALAEAAVERELAACVNVVPAVRSVYRWQGRVERDEEALLVLKTTRAAVAPLEELLRELHPYDTFEFVALDVASGSQPYLDWIADSVSTTR
jgi:periplasmic divalent cation tolerance protein